MSFYRGRFFQKGRGFGSLYNALSPIALDSSDEINKNNDKSILCTAKETAKASGLNINTDIVETLRKAKDKVLQVANDGTGTKATKRKKKIEESGVTKKKKKQRLKDIFDEFEKK